MTSVANELPLHAEHPPFGEKGDILLFAKSRMSPFASPTKCPSMV